MVIVAAVDPRPAYGSGAKGSPGRRKRASGAETSHIPTTPPNTHSHTSTKII